MKNIFYSLLGLTLLFSCSKDDSPSNPTVNGSCTVNSINSLYNEVLKIEYGGDGKIAKYSSGSNRNYSYTYSKTQIKVLEKYQSEVYDWDTKTSKVVSVENPYEYTLDDQNRIMKRTSMDANRIITYKYKYSADGLLLAITGDDGKIYSQIEYNNGNISGLNHPIFSETYVVESDPSKSYMPFSNLIMGLFSDNADEQDYILYEQGFFGKLPKKRINKISGSSKSGTLTQTFTYKEDSKGNVTDIDEYNAHTYNDRPQDNTSTVKTATLTYNCK
ncbi:DUF4595 domain-containing protein [Sphingobacterium siyangense]|uniref:DUF4595 domain-containing protein n=1 Tax=Sphingobacterium siyangense TaxID=459529 RepID=UPI003DA6B9DB